jgi:hypothetical protein
MADLQVLLSTTLVDADGDTKTFEVPAVVADSTTLAGLQTLLDAATECKIQSSSMNIAFNNMTGIKANAVALSDVEEGGLISFSVNGSKYRNSMFIPGIIDLAKTGNSINLAQTAIAALIVRLTSLVSGVTPGNKFGMANVAALEGKKRFRK